MDAEAITPTGQEAPMPCIIDTVAAIVATQPQNDSAQVCLADARTIAGRGVAQDIVNARAMKALAHTIGVFHPAYVALAATL